MTLRPPRILISGAGIAGLSFALALLKNSDCVPLIVERADTLPSGGYMIDFFGSGFDVAERLSLVPDLARIHYEIPNVAFVGQNGEEKFSLPYPDIRRRLFVERHFNFMRGDLARLLFDRIRDRVEIRFGTVVERLQHSPTDVRVRLSDGTEAAFDLLVGADGVHSHTRRCVLGDESPFLRFLGYEAIAFIVSEPSIARRIGRAFYTLTLPGRQVSVYPIGGGKLATLFLHAVDRPRTERAAIAVEDVLRTRYGDLKWIVGDLIAAAAADPHLYRDDVAQIELPTWGIDRVVWIGDAAHCVSLLAGQGASLAVTGAYVMAEELRAKTPDVRSAIAAYERRLKRPVVARQKAGRRAAGWFVPATTMALQIRDFFVRNSTRPLIAPILRRRMGAESVPLPDPT